jgi:glycosyltransferase involved in cell wall biosynthesis
MKISAIIPTFNRAKYTVKAVKSILDQTYSIDEIIVVDDGSNDNTKELLTSFPIQYIYQENKGVSSARNTGIKEAKNKWICFLDSDDIWEPKKIKKQVQFHEQNPHILFSHTNEKWIYNSKEIQKKTYQRKQYRTTFCDHIENTFIGCSTVMIHKNIFEQIGCFQGEQVFDENLKACEDYDLWLRILRKFELGFVDEELIHKLAGHKGQLSFETPLQDRYRIQALLKHIDSPYSKEIKSEIFKRCEILLKGAKKHQNKEIEAYYLKLKNSLF